MADDGYQQGWHERNGGNLSYRLKPEEVEMIKPRLNAPGEWEEIGVEDADYLIVAFGSIARICDKAREIAAEKGIKIGIVRPITLWPFPTEAINKAAEGKKGVLVVELNAGQMIEDVRLAVHDRLPVEHFGRMGGIIPSPEEVVTAMEEKIINRK